MAVPDDHRFRIIEFNRGLQRGGLFKDRQGNFILEDGLQTQLVWIVSRTGSATVDWTRLENVEQIFHRPVANVYEPTQDFLPRATEDVAKKENQFLKQHSQNKHLRLMPVLAEMLVVFDREKLPDSFIEFRLQRR